MAPGPLIHAVTESDPEEDDAPIVEDVSEDDKDEDDDDYDDDEDDDDKEDVVQGDITNQMLMDKLCSIESRMIEQFDSIHQDLKRLIYRLDQLNAFPKIGDDDDDDDAVS